MTSHMSFAFSLFVWYLQVRKRDKTFPVSTGNEYQYDQPTALAHIGKMAWLRSSLFCHF